MDDEGMSEEEVWQAGVDAMIAARRAAAAAFDAWHQAEQTFLGCPVWQERARQVRLPEPCDCHHPQVVAAHEAFLAAEDEVAVATARFKAGEL